MKELKKYLITVDTDWCGTEQIYSALAYDETELYDLSDHLAHENFIEMDCISSLIDEGVINEDDDDDYNYSNHYSSKIEEIDENDIDQLDTWNNCEIVYDCRKNENINN